MRIIGLTGGIASGKSTVSNFLREFGAIIIDADLIARKIVEVGKPAFKEIIDEFGVEILANDGSLNRKKLGNIVFNNPKALKRLNSITHYRIIEEIRNEINWHKQYSKNSAIIVDAALLVELNIHSLVDELWMVYVPMDIQRARLLSRDSITTEEANKRIDSQLPNEEKLKLSDKVIYNTGTLDDLKKQVLQNWLEICESQNLR